MLILSRQQEESVVVGSANGFERMLKVTVLEIKGGSVRLGFDVNRNFLVHRWEVWERIRANGLPNQPTGNLAATVDW
jgi:carbon storage regulator CsrA